MTTELAAQNKTTLSSDIELQNIHTDDKNTDDENSTVFTPPRSYSSIYTELINLRQQFLECQEEKNRLEAANTSSADDNIAVVQQIVLKMKDLVGRYRRLQDENRRHKQVADTVRARMEKLEVALSEYQARCLVLQEAQEAVNGSGSASSTDSSASSTDNNIRTNSVRFTRTPCNLMREESPDDYCQLDITVIETKHGRYDITYKYSYHGAADVTFNPFWKPLPYEGREFGEGVPDSSVPSWRYMASGVDGEIIFKNSLTEQMVEYLLMSDEELSKYSGNHMPTDYRCTILHNIAKMWD